jgi:hypothetical protein
MSYTSLRVSLVQYHQNQCGIWLGNQRIPCEDLNSQEQRPKSTSTVCRFSVAVQGKMEVKVKMSVCSLPSWAMCLFIETGL